MNIENVSLLHNELISCGLSISGCDSSGSVYILSRPTVPKGVTDWIDPTDSVIEAVKAAHGQPLTSDECLALQAALTEEQWLAYQDARKAPVKSARAERYRQKADPMRLTMDEDFTLNLEK